MITVYYYYANRMDSTLRSFTTFEGATVYHLKHFIGYDPVRLGVFTDLVEGTRPLDRATLLVDGETYYVV